MQISRSMGHQFVEKFVANAMMLFICLIFFVNVDEVFVLANFLHQGILDYIYVYKYCENL